MADPVKLKPYFIDVYGSTIRIDAPKQSGQMAKMTFTHPTTFEGEKVTAQPLIFEFWIDSASAIELSDILRASMDPMINELLVPNPTLFKNGG